MHRRETLHRNNFVPLGLLLLLSACSFSGGDSPSNELSAEEILSRAQSAYASLTSYSDRSVATLSLRSERADEGNAETVRSAIVFRAPDEFRLTYRSSNSNEARAILKEGDTEESWVEGAEIPIPGRGLRQALIGAHLDSLMISTIVPPLLLPSLSGDWSLVTLEDARRLSDQTLDGRPCHVVSGRAAAGEWPDRDVTLWIDAERFLVRRVETAIHYDGVMGPADFDLTVELTPSGTATSLTSTFRDDLWTIDG